MLFVFCCFVRYKKKPKFKPPHQGRKYSVSQNGSDVSCSVSRQSSSGQIHGHDHGQGLSMPDGMGPRVHWRRSSFMKEIDKQTGAHDILLANIDMRQTHRPQDNHSSGDIALQYLRIVAAKEAAQRPPEPSETTNVVTSTATHRHKVFPDPTPAATPAPDAKSRVVANIKRSFNWGTQVTPIDEEVGGESSAREANSNDADNRVMQFDDDDDDDAKLDDQNDDKLSRQQSNGSAQQIAAMEDLASHQDVMSHQPSKQSLSPSPPLPDHKMDVKVEDDDESSSSSSDEDIENNEEENAKAKVAKGSF